MFILVDSNNNVCRFTGSSIEYGVFDEPNMNKWKVTNDTCTFYVVGDYLKCIEVDSLPSDYVYSKYCYAEKDGFYLNNDYVEPINIDVEIKQLKKENIDLKAQLDKVQEVLDYLVMK